MPSAASISANGPVRLSATIADDLWLIGLYTAEGDNFYAVAGADLKKANIELVIASADQTVEEAWVSICRRAPTKSWS